MKIVSFALFLLAVRIDWLSGGSTMEDKSDRELIDQFRQSKQDKWLIGFMTRHRSLIIIRTLNYLKDEQETEDFIGTLFLKLRDSLQKDHHIKEPKAWLRRLITNTLIDQTRRQNLHQAFIQTPTELSEDHQNKSMLKLDSGMLSEAIESLHALPKMYIIKHFFQGKQNKEIADEMGLNMNQVRGARDRALKALKTTLSPVFFEYFNE